MSFAINPAIDLVMLCALAELKESGPLGFQLVVLNLIDHLKSLDQYFSSVHKKKSFSDVETLSFSLI